MCFKDDAVFFKYLSRRLGELPIDNLKDFFRVRNEEPPEHWESIRKEYIENRWYLYYNKNFNAFLCEYRTNVSTDLNQLSEVGKIMASPIDGEELDGRKEKT